MTNVNTAILNDQIDSITDRLHDINVALSVIERLKSMNKTANQRPEVIALETEYQIEQGYAIDTRQMLMSVFSEPVKDMSPTVIDNVMDSSPVLTKIQQVALDSVPHVKLATINPNLRKVWRTKEKKSINMRRMTEKVILSSPDAWTLDLVMENLRVVTGNKNLCAKAVRRDITRLCDDDKSVIITSENFFMRSKP